MSAGSTGSTGATLMLMHNSSGGQVSTIGMYRVIQANIQQGCTTNKGTGNPFGSGPFSTGGTTFLGQAIFANAGAQSIGSCTAQQIVFGSNAQYIVDGIPANFWIGPSDSVQVKLYSLSNLGKGNFNPTAFVAWSFTTITES
jgi:hypothetical protein